MRRTIPVEEFVRNINRPKFFSWTVFILIRGRGGRDRMGRAHALKWKDDKIWREENIQ